MLQDTGVNGYEVLEKVTGISKAEQKRLWKIYVIIDSC